MLVSNPSFIERHYLLAQSEWNKHETTVLISFKTDRSFPQIFTPRNSVKYHYLLKLQFPTIPHGQTLVYTYKVFQRTISHQWQWQVRGLRKGECGLFF